MGASSSSNTTVPSIPPAGATIAPAVAPVTNTTPATTTPTADCDADALKKVAMRCSSLQYDRWLHPQRHKGANPDYDECEDAFDAWKSCVLASRNKQ